MSDVTVLDVVVLCGGRSPEAEVSRRSGAAVAAALARRGHAVRTLEPDVVGLRALLDTPPDCVWLALHGPFGEDGTIQGYLEMVGIPYTGSGVLGSAIGMDKVAARRHLEGSGLAMAPQLVVTLADVDRLALPADWRLPVIVKPARGGSSIATTKVEAAEQLQKAVYAALAVDDRALVEQFLVGREFSVGLLDDEVLGDIEVVPGDAFYSYAAKYQGSGTRYLPNPELPPQVRTTMHAQARQVVRSFACEGPTRVDFIWVADAAPYFIEINTAPGMTERSLLPQIAAAAGVSFDELCERVAWGARCKC